MSKKKAVKKVKKVEKKEVREFDPKTLEGHKPQMDEIDEKEKVKEPVKEDPKPIAEEKPIIYSFESRSRCPRCNSINTKTTGRNRDIQYRKCLMPLCRNRYPSKGKIV